MKRALRIVVPIFLAVAVIISIGWYFTKYDPELTKDILVSQARILDNQGNHTLATWLYSLAYRHSGNDETIALELAEQYRANGNYTKAEYTLSNAIADGGSAELYIALCKLYVQQDKLLDAVTMLDNIADPNVKAQLDAIRPQAPQPTRSPGFYNEYISVFFTVPEGTIYLTTDGRYPTTANAAHTSPVALNLGETIFHSVTVSENGLVSPLSVTSFTVGGVIETVIIQDAAIDQAIRQELQVDADHVLYTNELWNITSLTVPHDATTLSDLEKLPYLRKLIIEDVDVPERTGLDDLDLSPIRFLTALEELSISYVTISGESLKAIASLPKMTTLTLIKCNLSTISPLSNSTALTYLDVSGNTIRDLTALESMTELICLDLSHNAVQELDCLSGLLKLTTLDLSYNSIESTSALGTCTALTTLNLSGNLLTGIEGLEELSQLANLSASFNALTNVDALAANTALIQLDISNNELSDISALSALVQLRTLDLSYNQVAKLPEFGMDSPLNTIKASHNNLKSMDELAGLEYLNYVDMEANSGLTSVNALAGCFRLVEVNVYGTGVREADALTDMGVIVKYTRI